MTNPWPSLAQTHGPKAVINPLISDAEYEAETARQEGIIFPLIASHLTGHERTALDYGCGAGRFTRGLNRLLRGPATLTTGYDPCREMLEHAPPILGVSWESDPPDAFFFRNRREFDIVLVAMVLCLPHVDPDAIADGLSRVLAPRGALFVIDHMTDHQPVGKWARFRPVSFYQDLFARYGVNMTQIGEDRQLDNPITILRGA